MTPENKDNIVMKVVEEIKDELKERCNVQLDEDNQKHLYEYLKRNINENPEVRFYKNVWDTGDILLLETETRKIKIGCTLRKSDGKMFVAINYTRTAKFDFRVFCRDHGIPEEIIDQVIKMVDLNKTVLIGVCKKLAKFEEIMQDEGVPVTVIEGTIASMDVGEKRNEFKFYVLENDIIIYLPFRNKNMSWYNYEL